MPPRLDFPTIAQLLERMDAVGEGSAPTDGIATGFPSVDRMLGGGLRRGDLVLLGGDVASGKSALALAMALRTAQAGRHALFLSGEMTEARVLERLLAIEGRARVDDLRGGLLDEHARATVGAVAVALRDLPLDVRRLPPSGFAGLADALGVHQPAGERLDLVVVDGLQSLAVGPRALDEELAATVRALKGLALDLDVALVATASLPRLVAPRPDMRPTLDDFGGLGALAQLADVVLALFREGMYDPARALEGATELLVRKNRNGPTGYVDLYFYAHWLRFEDMLDPDR
jgi:replicative DNA helicase